jgi:hypothetical protein
MLSEFLNSDEWKAIWRAAKFIGAGAASGAITGAIGAGADVVEGKMLFGVISLGGVISAAAKYIRSKKPDWKIWRILPL